MSVHALVSGAILSVRAQGQAAIKRRSDHQGFPTKPEAIGRLGLLVSVERKDGDQLRERHDWL